MLRKKNTTKYVHQNFKGNYLTNINKLRWVAGLIKTVCVKLAIIINPKIKGQQKFEKKICIRQCYYKESRYSNVSIRQNIIEGKKN